MVKPQFTRKKFDANVAQSERHMELLWIALGSPKDDGWTDDVDLLVGHLGSLSPDDRVANTPCSRITCIV